MPGSPRNSAEVAIKIIDKARSMGIPVKMESSLVFHSDSRYVILFPGTVAEAVIRISSHKPYENRYALCLGVHRPDLLRTAADVAFNWMENTYGDGKLQATASRGGLALARVPDRGRGRNGHMRRRGLDDLSGGSGDYSNGVRRRVPRRLRGAGPLPERPRGEVRRIRLELTGDD